MFRNQDSAALKSFFEAVKGALLSCAATLQYESSTLPAEQMNQTVLPEKFTKKQQYQSRLDGGVELDGSKREELAITADELPGHHVLEHRKAAAEGRAPVAMYSQASLQGCHQSLMPSYRLPQILGERKTLDEYGMHCEAQAAISRPGWPLWNFQVAEDGDETERVKNPSVSSSTAAGDRVVQPASHLNIVEDANQFALSYSRDFRALHQLNHDHDCTATCIKYVAKKCKEAAEDALRKGKVVLCRFFFFHVLAFNRDVPWQVMSRRARWVQPQLCILIGQARPTSDLSLLTASPLLLLARPALNPCYACPVISLLLASPPCFNWSIPFLYSPAPHFYWPISHLCRPGPWLSSTQV